MRGWSSFRVNHSDSTPGHSKLYPVLSKFPKSLPACSLSSQIPSHAAPFCPSCGAVQLCTELLPALSIPGAQSFALFIPRHTPSLCTAPILEPPPPIATLQSDLTSSTPYTVTATLCIFTPQPCTHHNPKTFCLHSWVSARCAPEGGGIFQSLPAQPVSTWDSARCLLWLHPMDAELGK